MNKNTVMMKILVIISTAGLMAGCVSSDKNSHVTTQSKNSVDRKPEASQFRRRTPASAEPTLFNGVDISSIVQFARRNTFIISKPLIMYNWSYQPAMQLQLPSDGEDALRFAKSFAELYWKAQYTNPKSHNNFGSGFYLASEPVISRSYADGLDGKDKSSWILTQITLPAGLRIFDWHDYREDLAPAESESIKSSLLALGCEPDLLYEKGGFSELLMAPKHDSRQDCIRALDNVFNTIAPIDAFAYDYSAVPIAECSAATQAGVNLMAEAFVITKSAWMRPEMVTVFNHLTSSHKADRNIIQTLFNRIFPPLSQKAVENKMGPLWPDINGASDESDITKFVTQNYFGCNGDRHYQKSDR